MDRRGFIIGALACLVKTDSVLEHQINENGHHSLYLDGKLIHTTNYGWRMREGKAYKVKLNNRYYAVIDEEWGDREEYPLVHKMRISSIGEDHEV
jgi:hypothetical protein